MGLGRRSSLLRRIEPSGRKPFIPEDSPMPSPYDFVPHLLARYRTRLLALAEEALDAILDTARGAGLDLRVDDPSRLIAAVDPILARLREGDHPALGSLDRDDVAELLALSG